MRSLLYHIRLYTFTNTAIAFKQKTCTRCQPYYHKYYMLSSWKRLWGIRPSPYSYLSLFHDISIITNNIVTNNSHFHCHSALHLSLGNWHSSEVEFVAMWLCFFSLPTWTQPIIIEIYFFVGFRIWWKLCQWASTHSGQGGSILPPGSPIASCDQTSALKCTLRTGRPFTQPRAPPTSI